MWIFVVPDDQKERTNKKKKEEKKRKDWQIFGQLTKKAVENKFYGLVI